MASTALRINGERVIEIIPGVTLSFPESKAQGGQTSKEVANKKKSVTAIPKADKHKLTWLVCLGPTSNMTKHNGPGKESLNRAGRQSNKRPHENLKTSVENLLKRPCKSLKLVTPAKEPPTVEAVLTEILHELNNEQHSKEANTTTNAT